MKAFGSDLNRYLSDAVNHYQQYLHIEREKALLPGWMRWKSVNGSEYLVQGESGGQQQKSLGPRSAETQTLYDEFRAAKERLAAAGADIQSRLLQRAPLLRVLGINKIPVMFARIVRRYDIEGVLGHYIWVGGTHAIHAYEILAGCFLAPELGATEDLDLVWPENQQVLAIKPPKNLLGVLKAVDATFTVNEENLFQVRNSKGMVVDFITSAKGEQQTPKERLRPIGIEGQEWLMLLPPVEVVAIDETGLPVRLMVPDPRLFALHKLWVAQRADRNRLKVAKDRQQGLAILHLLVNALPGFELDGQFSNILPSPLQEILAQHRPAPDNASEPLM